MFLLASSLAAHGMQGFKAPRSATPPPPLPAPTLLVQVQGDEGYNYNALGAPHSDLQILEISRMASCIAGIFFRLMFDLRNC